MNEPVKHLSSLFNEIRLIRVIFQLIIWLQVKDHVQGLQQYYIIINLYLALLQVNGHIKTLLLLVSSSSGYITQNKLFSDDFSETNKNSNVSLVIPKTTVLFFEFIGSIQIARNYFNIINQQLFQPLLNPNAIRGTRQYKNHCLVYFTSIYIKGH